MQESWIKRSLCAAPVWVFTTYAIAASFSTYYCMYAFRKPFSAAKYEGMEFRSLSFGGEAMELKTALVISQIIGYALSKYVGIKVCSEITHRQRPWALIGLVLVSQAALLLFAVVPGDWKVLAIFLNGFPLGMVWGLVVWYLEGRRTSELLLAGLSCSFILASGHVKETGRWLLEDWHIGEAWMPAATGFVYLPFFLLSVFLLHQLPQASIADEAARTKRLPMGAARRWAFFRHFLWAFLMLIVTYFFLTAYRDFRDNYQVEVLEELGYSYQSNKQIIAQTETLVAVGVMACLALLNCFQNNRLGLVAAYLAMANGTALMGGATLLLNAQWISGFWWMTLVGLGAYLAYVPFGSLLFDRIMASTGVVGTAVFAIYLMDAIGYTGSVGVQLYRDFFERDTSRLAFLIQYTFFMSFLGTALLLGSCVALLHRRPTQRYHDLVETVPAAATPSAAPTGTL